jgi:hypothetical protein
MMTFRQMAASFIRNEHGFILTSEFLLSATVTVLGLLVGIANVRNSLLYELQEIAAVVGKLNQTYDYTGVLDGDALTQGGLFADSEDASDPPGLATNTLNFEDPDLDPSFGGEQ